MEYLKESSDPSRNYFSVAMILFCKALSYLDNSISHSCISILGLCLLFVAMNNQFEC